MLDSDSAGFLSGPELSAALRKLVCEPSEAHPSLTTQRINTLTCMNPPVDGGGLST